MTSTAQQVRSVPDTPSRTRTLRNPETGAAWRFLAPFGALYLLFILGPLAYGVLSSLFAASLVRPGLGEFIGLQNYADVLGSSLFWTSLRNTLLFTALTTVPLVLIGLITAILVNRVARAQWFFRLAFFLPYMLPSATMALIWLFVFSPGLGLFDSFLGVFGFEAQGLLGNPSTAMLGVAIATVWWTLGFNFILYLAGLQEIPKEHYEAASLDGATTLQQIRFIVLPQLRNTTVLVIVLQIVASLKVFDQMFIMTGGGPGTSTTSVLQYVYNTGFTDYRVGAASAASTLFFLIIVAVSAVWMISTRRQQR